MSLSDPIIHNDRGKSHSSDTVTSLDEYRGSRMSKEQKEMGEPQHAETLLLERTLKPLGLKGLVVLWLISQNPNGIKNKEIRSQTGLTISPVKRLAKICINAGLVVEDRVPSPGGIKPTSFFRLNTDRFDRSSVVSILQAWGIPDRVQLVPQSLEKASKKNLNESPVPDLFQPYFEIVKASARAGLWETFLFLCSFSPASEKDLRKGKGWASSVASDRLRKLVKSGLAARTQDGVYVYFLTEEAISLCQKANINIQATKQRSLSTESKDTENKTELQKNAHTLSNSAAMSNDALLEIKSTVKFLANQVIKLTKQVEQLQKGQESQMSGFKEEIEHMFQSAQEDETKQ